jgi:hypothetical protein
MTGKRDTKRSGRPRAPVQGRRGAAKQGPSAASTHSAPAPLDPPEKEPELLELPEGARSLSFWGWSARIKLGADVLLRYVTEPPHGNPLYAMRIDGRIVGRSDDPALFFASNVHVAPDRTLIALNGYGGDGALLQVVHLTEFRVWSLAGLARVRELDDLGVTAELWPPGESSYRSPARYAFPPLAEWTVADDVAGAMLAHVAWTRYRL